MVKVGRLDLRTRGGIEGRPGRTGFTQRTGFCPLAVVADVLCEFLEVAVHLILYVREVYPVGIFQKRKKYNVPVQVSPHSHLGPLAHPPITECVEDGFLKFFHLQASALIPHGLALPSSFPQLLVAW